MHVYMRLIQLFPWLVILGHGNGIIPAGFAGVVTSRGNNVVTSRAFVIAKNYV